MARSAVGIIGERTFYLRDPSSVHGMAKVHVRVTERGGRILVDGAIPPGTDEMALRAANPEVSGLFDIVSLGRLLEDDRFARKVVRGDATGTVIPFDLPVLSAARAIHSEGLERAGPFAEAAARAASGARGRPGMDEARFEAVGAGIGKGIEDACLGVAVDEVMRPWARARLLDAMHVLDPGGSYHAAGSRRRGWDVGREVLDTLREGGMAVNASLAEDYGPGEEYKIVLMARNLFRLTSVTVRKGHPYPALEWALKFHLEQREPLPTVEQATARILEAYARLGIDKDDPDANAREDALRGIASRVREREEVVDLVGEECLSRAIAVLPEDPLSNLGDRACGPSACLSDGVVPAVVNARSTVP